MLPLIHCSPASRLACPASPFPSTCCRVFRKELLCPLSSGVPENARGVLGCLTNVIRVYPASKHQIVSPSVRPLNRTSRLYTLHPTLYTKKSHSPCAYAIFLLPLRSNLLHRIYYKNNHHYPSSNYGTQILSSMWCRVYLSARESRQVPMCRCDPLSCYSCTSGSTIPQPMPLPQVPVGVLCLSNVCLLSRIVIRVFPASKP